MLAQVAVAGEHMDVQEATGSQEQDPVQLSEQIQGNYSEVPLAGGEEGIVPFVSKFPVILLKQRVCSMRPHTYHIDHGMLHVWEAEAEIQNMSAISKRKVRRSL